MARASFLGDRSMYSATVGYTDGSTHCTALRCAALRCAALRCTALHHWRNDWTISHRTTTPVPTRNTDMWRRRLSNQQCCEHSSPLSRCAFG